MRGVTSARGFTLLEVLIVLALMAFAAAMVAPRLQRTYDAIAGSGERAEVVRQLERLPMLARESGQALVVPADGTMPSALAFPAGWSVQPADALRVEASGVCHAGAVLVTGRGTRERWELAAPDCGVRDAR